MPSLFVRRPWIAASAAFSLIVTASAGSQAQTPDGAQAQEPLALSRLNPAWSGDRFFAVRGPSAPGHLKVHGGLLFNYAHNPLVLRLRDASGSTRTAAIVKHQMLLHANVSFAVWNRLMVNVDLPMAVLQRGDNPSFPQVAFDSPSGFQVGDLRLGARGRIWGQDDGVFQIGAGGELWVPTGASDEGDFVGNGAVRGALSASAAGVVSRFLYGVELGTEFRDGQTFAGLAQGSMLTYGAGAGALVGPNKEVQLGAELAGALTYREVQARTTNIEALLGAKVRFAGDYVVGAAAGPGVTSGVGTPDFRGLLSFTYSPQRRAKAPAVADRDRDGIGDDDDACPDTAGEASPDTTLNGCPPPSDRDDDGIADEDDRCPEVPGAASDDPEAHGCPLPEDQDGDGIVDDEDACPAEAGVASDTATKHGCPVPPDSDEDGVLDQDDACPEDAGPANEDPKKHGCPKVVVRGDSIVIMERVEFATSKATIRDASRDVIDQVAQVMRAHPEIERVEVQGHTDNRGNRRRNTKLSQRRAEAVVRALVKLGIEADRLEAKGYGPDEPIADNETSEGRSENRRVQFNIVRRAGSQAAADSDPVEE